jgi:hypothetical protein
MVHAPVVAVMVMVVIVPTVVPIMVTTIMVVVAMAMVMILGLALHRPEGDRGEYGERSQKVSFHNNPLMHASAHLPPLPANFQIFPSGKRSHGNCRNPKRTPSRGVYSGLIFLLIFFVAWL